MNSEIDIMMEALVSKLTEALGRRMVFFVGAGISIPSGVPGFRTLNEQVIRLTTGNKLRDEEYKFLSGNLRPEVVLQIFEEELGPKVLTCLEAFVGHSPNPNHFFLAEALRRGNWVFTTNGDNLIEQACELRGIGIKNKVCYTDTHFEQFRELLKSISNPQNTPGGYIFKLHGSVEEDKEEDERFRTFLLTLHQVGRGLSETKGRALKYFLQNFDFCFMGYSCLDDFSIYPVLRDTDSERLIFWFKYAKGPIGEIIWGKERLQNEKEVEESKPPGEKNWETINVNSVLLKRRASFKFVGNSSEFVQNRLCPPLEIGRCAYPDLLKQEKYQDGFSEWAKGIEEYKRNLILGRLWETCWRRDEAIRYFEEAEKLGEGKHKAKAKQMLARVYDRQYGKEKAEVVIKYYGETFKIFKEFGADFEAAQVKIDLANFKRRALQQFPEAKKYAEEAKLLLEPIKDKSKEHELAYARCLNVLGLVHFGLKTKNNLTMGHILCKESKDIKEKHGDVDGVAESENAIGLIRREEGKDNIDLIKEAIRHFETALACREKIGNYRGCGHHFRNLGLCYTDLIELVLDKKEEYFQLAKEYYEKGIANWYMIKPGEPPIEELLEFRFRLGELHVKYGDKNEAIKQLQPVEQKRRELGDWHNRARCLDLLREAYKHSEQMEISISREIVFIYRDVLSDENKLKEMRDAKIKFKNAEEILKRTKEIVLEVIYPPEVAMEEAKEVDKILEELKRRVG
ncbi:MAG: SIR2 family protein [archaeon]|nr:SIR2 family protein [archaeon]